jgi:CubicO group peptidase (beta-lactamase class C family)
VTGRLDALLAEGAASGVFPQASAVVRWRGEVVFESGAGGATGETVFDLASLTKALGTTPLFLSLWAEGKVEPDGLADLLAHRAGLPAFVPFFAAALRRLPRLLDADCPPELRAAARRAVVDDALAVAPLEPPRGRAVYSDVGFIALGERLSVAAGAPLDAAFGERVAAPLGLGFRFRRLSARPGDAAGIAPTGRTRPREPAPGQEGLWSGLPAVVSRPGEVDDDNAWVMDGVAGHAGLFGTAADVARFGQAVLEELDGAGRIAPRSLWEEALRRDVVTPGSTRALGFDTRLPGDSTADSSAGRYIGQALPGAVGHLGFTGTSLWIDRARRLVVALCTNRTALGRASTRIRDFRPRFHDAVVESLGATR